MQLIDFLIKAGQAKNRYMELKYKAAGNTAIRSARLTGTPGNHTGIKYSIVEETAETMDQAARLLPQAKKEYLYFADLCQQLENYYLANMKAPRFPSPFTVCIEIYFECWPLQKVARIHQRTPASIKATIKRGINGMNKILDPETLDGIAAGRLIVDGSHIIPAPPESNHGEE